MKRAGVLFLAVLLILTGCRSKDKINDVSANDVCCPYEISHKDDGIDITLQDGKESGILWSVEVIPEDICEVSQVDVDKAFFCQYRINGKEEGAAQLIFSALTEDTVQFTLTLVVDVDAKGKAVVSDCRHWERAGEVVDTDGLKYKWHVDEKGTLNFSFINKDDFWQVSGDGDGVCTLAEVLSTPSGCKFSVQANASGQATVQLMGETSQRVIEVKIQADDNGKLEVISVQEQ